ncbi:MAG: TetR/AcrR family transcriptional regulator [Anaerolineales bacterium]|nr:TetR/AcrR family transcriptional regulator [Anaerolineales bacterium]
MTTRSDQKEIRRKQILTAALDLLIQKGFAGTKISDIANAVGMSVGLLFHYFDSKERIYEELVQMGFAKSQSMMTANRAEPLAFFENMAELILDQAGNDPFSAKMFVLMSQAAANDFLPEEIRNHLKGDVIRKSAKIIRAGQSDGTIRKGDPLALSVAFWAAIQGICQVIALDADLPCPDSSWVVDILRNKKTGG